MFQSVVHMMMCMSLVMTTSIEQALHDIGDASLVMPLDFEHRLRICNAYPSRSSMDVFNGKSQLTNTPLGYKTCRDFLSHLEVGDEIEFRMDTQFSGVFRITELPNNDAIMLLVIHRHDAESAAVAFESHVFANLMNAQIALIDTYKGPLMARINITDGARPQNKSERLHFDTVVAVNEGRYEIGFGEHSRLRPFIALNRESYVLIRTGVAGSVSFPEDLIIFPPSGEKGGASHIGASLCMLLTILVAMHNV